VSSKLAVQSAIQQLPVYLQIDSGTAQRLLQNRL
jgi:hypothetical protein